MGAGVPVRDSRVKFKPWMEQQFPCEFEHLWCIVAPSVTRVDPGKAGRAVNQMPAERAGSSTGRRALPRDWYPLPALPGWYPPAPSSSLAVKWGQAWHKDERRKCL